MKGRIVLIFIIITLLTNIFLLNAVSQNCNIDFTKQSSDPLRVLPKVFNRALVKGNASSGKQFGIFGKIGIIKFNYAQFVIIRFFPIKLIVNKEQNVTAFMFGIDQQIPTGSFDFDEEWIAFAIVI